MSRYTDENGDPKVPSIVRDVLISMLVLTVFFSSWSVVSPGEKGVITRLGMVAREASPGLNFMLPIIEDMTKFDVRTQKDSFEASAASKDLQTVTAKIAVNYNLEANAVTKMYVEVGTDYVSRLLGPSVQESVKASTAKFSAEELITKRAEVKDSITQTLAERMQKVGILISNVSIIDFDFSKSFNNAIEDKVTAEQEALAQKNKLEQVKYEAEQRVAQAKAEAEAIKIQAQAVTSQGGADYVKLKWIEKWNGVLPSTSLGEGTPMINIK